MTIFRSDCVLPQNSQMATVEGMTLSDYWTGFDCFWIAVQHCDGFVEVCASCFGGCAMGCSKGVFAVFSDSRYNCFNCDVCVSLGLSVLWGVLFGLLVIGVCSC